MRGKPLSEVTWEKIPVEGRGIGRVEGQLTNYTMVCMEDVLIIKGPVGGIVGKENIWPVLADHAYQLPAELQ